MFLTEDYCVCLTAQGEPEPAGLAGQTKTLITNLARSDLDDGRLYLVCRAYRRGTLVEGSKKRVRTPGGVVTCGWLACRMHTCGCVCSCVFVACGVVLFGCVGQLTMARLLQVKKGAEPPALKRPLGCCVIHLPPSIA